MLTGSLSATALTCGGPLALGLVLVCLAAAVTTGSPARRAVGLAIGVTGMLPVWLVPADHVVVRSLWVLAAFCGAMRCSDLCRGSWPIGARLAHVLSIVDTRRLVRVRPSVDVGATLEIVGWGLLTAPAYYAVSLHPYSSPVRPTDWLVRWVLGLVLVYTFSAGAYRVLHVAYRAAGFATPALHVAPALSRSVQEFWGERWNRTVSLWLGETFFRPLARRRHPLLGALAAFVASAVVHAYVAWVAVGGAMAACMLVFFVAQAAIIFAERALAVRAWAPWAGHAWTVAWMSALSPLFTEALVRVFES